MRFRRKKRKTAPAAPFDYSTLPNAVPATLDEMITEGVMLAEFAGRMALKNQIVIGVLTSSDDYDQGRYLATAREVIAEIAAESDESASLARTELETAAGRSGVGLHQHDYRSSDTRNLRLREDVHSRVASRLLESSRDAEYLADFVESARGDAWLDIGRAITAKLDRDWPQFAEQTDPSTEPGYERNRAKRMRTLRRDVARLSGATGSDS